MRLRPYFLSLLIFFSFALCSLPAGSAAMDAHTEATLQAALEEAVAEYNIAGAMAAVRSPGGQVWYGCAGYADLANRIPFTPDTRCGIGSTTKTFTSTVVLQLVDEGKFALDDTVEDLLPGLLTVGGQVTVRDLLLMRSGLNHYESNPVFGNTMNQDPRHLWTMEELSRLSDGLAFTPDTGYDYNNVNYMILGLVIEKFEGMPWYQSIAQRLTGPLGMSGTGAMIIDLTPSQPAAVPYRYADGQTLDATCYTTATIAQSSGAMYSTVNDLLTWMTAFFDGSLLSPEMQKLRLQGVPIPGSNGAFGMGIGIYPSVRSFGFGGNLNDLYTSQWSVICNWQFALLTNGQNGPPQGTDTSAKGIYSKMAKALGLGKAMGDAR